MRHGLPSLSTSALSVHHDQRFISLAMSHVAVAPEARSGELNDSQQTEQPWKDVPLKEPVRLRLLQRSSSRDVGPIETGSAYEMPAFARLAGETAVPCSRMKKICRFSDARRISLITMSQRAKSPIEWIALTFRVEPEVLREINAIRERHEPLACTLRRLLRKAVSSEKQADSGADASPASCL